MEAQMEAALENLRNARTLRESQSTVEKSAATFIDMLADKMKESPERMEYELPVSGACRSDVYECFKNHLKQIYPKALVTYTTNTATYTTYVKIYLNE